MILLSPRWVLPSWRHSDPASCCSFFNRLDNRRSRLRHTHHTSCPSLSFVSSRPSQSGWGHTCCRGRNSGNPAFLDFTPQLVLLVDDEQHRRALRTGQTVSSQPKLAGFRGPTLAAVCARFAVLRFLVYCPCWLAALRSLVYCALCSALRSIISIFYVLAGGPIVTYIACGARWITTAFINVSSAAFFVVAGLVSQLLKVVIAQQRRSIRRLCSQPSSSSSQR